MYLPARYLLLLLLLFFVLRLPYVKRRVAVIRHSLVPHKIDYTFSAV